MSTAIYPHIERNVIYPTLGLCGEAGELANKVKKLIRDTGYESGSGLTREERQPIIEELGDCLWYIAALATECGMALNDVAIDNVAKLAQRQADGTLQGSGDHR
jgi:NTP pyrophosphatase (non-canonical NTP hydrolase)